MCISLQFYKIASTVKYVRCAIDFSVIWLSLWSFQRSRLKQRLTCLQTDCFQLTISALPQTTQWYERMSLSRRLSLTMPPALHASDCTCSNVIYWSNFLLHLGTHSWCLYACYCACPPTCIQLFILQYPKQVMVLAWFELLISHMCMFVYRPAILWLSYSLHMMIAC